jgi:hypothetical protein
LIVGLLLEKGAESGQIGLLAERLIELLDADLGTDAGRDKTLNLGDLLEQLLPQLKRLLLAVTHVLVESLL